MNNVEVKTMYDMNAIRQIVNLNHGMTVTRQEQIIKLADEGVKEALEKLGYVNPEQANYQENLISTLRSDRDILMEENRELKADKEHFEQSNWSFS